MCGVHLEGDSVVCEIQPDGGVLLSRGIGWGQNPRGRSALVLSVICRQESCIESRPPVWFAAAQDPRSDHGCELTTAPRPRRHRGGTGVLTSP